MDYIIRPIEIKDAAGINAMRRMPGVMENILGAPSERIEKSEVFIKGLGPLQHHFVAIVNDNNNEVVVGCIHMEVAANPRVCHSASLGIMVHKDYQNAGVGTALINEIISLADNWLGLIRLELTVFEDNDRAIHLYEKLGFKKEGLRLFSGLRMGEYVNEYYMARINPRFLK